MTGRDKSEVFKEQLFKDLDLPVQEWNGEDAELLRRALTLPAVRKALAIVWQQQNRDKLIAISTCNFQTPEGITKATRLQGEMGASVRIIETLISLTVDEEEQS